MCAEKQDLLTGACAFAVVPNSMTLPGTRPGLNDGGDMATGAKHQRLTEISESIMGDEERRYSVPCRCAIGEDHNDPQVLISQYDPNDDNDDDGGSLSVSDAADIWRSRGEDEDYMFGYGEDELRRAADDD